MVLTTDQREIAVPGTGRLKEAQAAAWPADLIVLTRRPRPAIACLDLGSTPDQVMRQASCPMLAIPTRQDDREHRPL